MTRCKKVDDRTACAARSLSSNSGVTKYGAPLLDRLSHLSACCLETSSFKVWDSALGTARSGGRVGSKVWLRASWMNSCRSPLLAVLVLMCFLPSRLTPAPRQTKLTDTLSKHHITPTSPAGHAMQGRESVKRVAAWELIHCWSSQTIPACGQTCWTMQSCTVLYCAVIRPMDKQNSPGWLCSS